MNHKQNNVLMIGWEYPPHNSGGLGVACEGLTKALTGLNQQLYFTLPYNLQVAHMKVLGCYDPKWKNASNQPPFYQYHQSSASAMNIRRRLDRDELHALPQSQLEQKVDQYSNLVSQSAVNAKKPFEVIHAHDWMTFPAAIKVKRKLKKPMIAHIHSTEYDRIPSGYGSQYIIQTEKEGLQTADKVIAVSYYTKRLLIQKYDIPAAKIEVVYNGLVIPSSLEKKPSEASFAQHRPVIVFMGRLTAQKGAEYFLDVAQRVLAKIPDALFILAGSGDMYHELLFRSADHTLSASVLFSGFVRDKQKIKLLERADLFIMPSISEPFGLVALEAAVQQTPVIISKNSGVSEVMRSSIAIDFWDVNKMVETVLKVLNDQVLAKKIVDGQNQDLKKVTWKKSAQKVKKIYQTLSL